MENQDFVKLLEEIRAAGMFYNDADLAKKAGFSRSHISEMRSGKKPVTDLTIMRLHETFPSFFSGEADGDPQRTTANEGEALLRALDEIGEQRKLVAQSQGLIAKNQEQIDRLLLIIEKLT